MQSVSGTCRLCGVDDSADRLSDPTVSALWILSLGETGSPHKSGQYFLHRDTGSSRGSLLLSIDYVYAFRGCSEKQKNGEGNALNVVVTFSSFSFFLNKVKFQRPMAQFNLGHWLLQ